MDKLNSLLPCQNGNEWCACPQQCFSSSEHWFLIVCSSFWMFCCGIAPRQQLVIQQCLCCLKSLSTHFFSSSTGFKSDRFAGDSTLSILSPPRSHRQLFGVINKFFTKSAWVMLSYLRTSVPPQIFHWEPSTQAMLYFSDAILPDHEISLKHIGM